MCKSFNRYMVECKSSDASKDLFPTCFNRYMVECKYILFR